MDDSEKAEKAQSQVCLSVERELGSAQQHHERIRWTLQYLILAVLLFFSISFWGNIPGTRISSHKEHTSCGSSKDSTLLLDSNSNLPRFDWDRVKPSKGLNWTKCYDTFICAKLTVPLDYADPSGEGAAVAVVKSASRYSPGDKDYKGPILFNPGGPGGSGVVFILNGASSFRKIIGEEFDLIGFDPRGVGWTTPHLSAFSSKQEAGALYLQYPTNINASIGALGEAYAASDVLGKLVEDRSRHVAQHVSTPTVARDMLSIIDAEGHEKLQYWGFSYGTVLGATFAAMFPDKVGRMIIDGVVDSENYNAGKWSNNLLDTDAALLDVYQACVTAGPSKCAIHENSTTLIQERVDKLLHKLKTAPLPLYRKTAAGSEYDIVGFALVKAVIFSTLYNTHGGGGKHLADALAELEKGNPEPIYALSNKRVLKSISACNCPAPEEEPQLYPEFLEVNYAIACGDAGDSHESLDDIREAYEEMAKDSVFADGWEARIICSGWKVRAKDRFEGTFEKNTSHPLLLVGTVADPVTPLSSAYKMSQGFTDSIFLTQNSSGHCSISATSLCTMKAVRTYFLNGTLPGNGTICQPESKIFDDDLELDMHALSSEDQELLKASQFLQKSYLIPQLGSRFTRVQAPAPNSRISDW